MSLFPQLVLIIWFPIVVFLCYAFPVRQAILLALLGAFLLLPSRAGFDWPLVPDYEKLSSAYYGLIVGILLFHGRSLLNYRFHPIDIPILTYGFCNIFTSLSNDLGFYDGMVQSLANIFRWTIPYFLGRIYFTSLKDLKEFAVLLIKAGIVYMPLCLWEIRMSPHLHQIIYGYFSHPSGIAQQARSFGLWRPIVFTGHGLVASLFMFFTFFLAFWLWQSKAIDQIWGVSLPVWSALLGFTFVMMQSRGTYAYALIMGVIFIAAKFWKSNVGYLLILTLILYYMYSVMSGQFDGSRIVSWIAQNISPERAQSLAFRWDNELDMAAKARVQPLLGWGNWGRNRVYAYDWKGEIVDTSVTDSIFILLYGINGVVGILSFYGSMLIPSLMFCVKQYPAKVWFHPKVGAASALAVFTLAFCIDSLLNAPVQPPLMVACGALAGLVIKPAESLSLPSSKPKTLPDRRSGVVGQMGILSWPRRG